jgi:GT2 family glycosyltransferase
MTTPPLTIGVPIRNQLPFVRACLETVVRYRMPGAQLLLIDDASEYDTREYLEGFAATVPGVDLLRNRRHSGFPYSANEILNSSSGPVLCLLNSDTLVTPHWDRLVVSAMDANERFALAGPSTSYAHTEQEVPGLRLVRMHHDAETAARIAAELERIYTGKIQRVRQLGGFCLFLRRSLVRQVGYFDERFGLGCGEEDDFVMRARRRGVIPIWVRSSYVHHFGHCSFTAEPGVDSAELWARNRQLMEIKQLVPEMAEKVHPMSKKEWL